MKFMNSNSKTMKNTILFLAILISLTGIIACGGGTDNSPEGEIPVQPEEGAAMREKGVELESQAELIADHIDGEKASGVRHDTIVLDFRFGMSKKQLYRHTKKMQSEKKMYRIEKTRGKPRAKKVWEYVYDLRLRDAGKMRTFFDAYYHDEELYKVECLPNLKEEHDPKEVLDEIYDMFKAKYGKRHFKVKDEDDEECYYYLWIDGNRRIELGCREDKVFIYYIDIPMAEKAAKEMDF